MKKVTKLNKSLLVLLLTLMVMCAGLVFTVGTALADDGAYEFREGRQAFQYQGLNRPMSGTDSAKVEAAFEIEVARLYREIDAYDAANEVTTSIGFIAGTHIPLGQNWPGGNNGVILALLRASGSDYANPNVMWGADNVNVLVAYNPLLNKAFTVKNSFVQNYIVDGGWYSLYNLGYPVSNEFEIDGVKYQNFALGYLCETDGNTTTNRGFRAVDNDGELQRVELTPEDVAENIMYPVFDGGSGTQIAGINHEDIQAAYIAYCNTVNSGDAIVGNYFYVPADFAPYWRQNINVGTTDGDFIVYNPGEKLIAAISGSVKTAWNLATWGYPTGNVVEFDGEGFDHYQNFDKGVITINEGVVEFFESSRVNEETGEVGPAFLSGDAGRLSEDALALLDGVDQDAFFDAVSEVYSSSEMGLPVALMEAFAGKTNAFYQKFIRTIPGDGETADVTVFSEIHVSVQLGAATAIAVKSDAYKLYELPPRYNGQPRLYDVPGATLLGQAKTAEFTVSGKTYQNFEYGAINITDKITLSGVNISGTGTRTILDLSSSIVLSTTSINYPSSFGVTTAQLLEKFTAAYKALIQSGFAAGMPNKEGIAYWEYKSDPANTAVESDFESQGMIKLGLHSTDSIASSWHTINAFLAFNPEDGNVYLVKDGAMNSVGLYYNSMGAPRANQTPIKNGQIIIQNFQGGYLTISPNTNVAAPKWGVNYSTTLGGEVNLDGSKIDGVEYENDDDENNNNNNNNNETPKRGCRGTVTGSVGATGAGLVLVVTVLCFVIRRRRV